jgi:hypothetical protein
VPIFLRAATPKGVMDQTLLLTDRQARVELPEGADWVVVNAGGHGFYRVRYSADLLRRMMKAKPEETEALQQALDTLASARGKGAIGCCPWPFLA